ncbi:MAG: hypothetical protein ACJAS1_005557 [Oleiphilaceae bacterium]|jgi:hypothetical protein
MKYIYIIFVILVVSNSAYAGETEISESQLDGKWPLTVKSGTLSCKQIPGVKYGQLVTFTTGQDTYALNGTARGHAKKRGWIEDITPIWKDNPEIFGTKIDIGSLINSGLKLCK